MPWLLPILLAFTFTFFASGRAGAAEVRARTSVIPTAGTAVGIGGRVALAAQFEARRLVGTGGEDPGDTSMFVRGGVRVGVTPMVSLLADYGYARGSFPVDGSALQEHVVQLGMSAGRHSRASRRFGVANRLRVDLRALESSERRWHLEARPRNEVALTGFVLPWLRVSIVSEALLHPSYPIEQLLQVRAGPALHGTVALRPGGADKGPRLLWFVAAPVAMWPIGLARPESELRSLDVLVRFGLSGVF